MRRSLSPRFGSTLAITVLATLALAGCVNAGDTNSWALEDTQINAAQALGRTGQGIRVGVLDTGLDPNHPALEHLIDGDNSNGELKGFRDFIANDFGVRFAHDDHGHGSHVIGIMSAQGAPLTDQVLYGGIDPRGAAPHVQLWVAKVCAPDPASDDRETTCPDQAIREALQWMRSQSLDIVTMSLGGPHRDGTLIFQDATTNAVNALIDNGVVVVASAGNSGTDAGDVSSPADIEGVIAVGAMQKDGKVWRLSSRGNDNDCGGNVLFQSGRCAPNQKPEVIAPGVDIWSTWTDGVYARASGTSQAAPFVASALALLLESESRITDRAGVMAVKQALMDSSKPMDGQHRPHDDAYGYGLLQAKALIDAY